MNWIKETSGVTSTRVAGALALVMTVGLGAAGESPLIDAARSGNVRAVRTLIQQKVDVNAPAPDGTTPLHWAATRDDVESVDLLLRAGAKVAATNRYGMSPLQLAATNGNAEIIERLLKAGANPNTALPDGETVLMTAARTGKVPAVKALVAAGADVRTKEPLKGQTALMWAAAENNADVIKALVELGADPAERTAGGSFTAYLFAVRAGHVEASRALVGAGVPVDEALVDGTTALVLATINAHYELASALLDLGANPNADAQGWTALHQIAWSRRHNAGFNLPGPVQTGGVDSLDLARKLVKMGADVNARQKKEPRDGNRNLQNRIGATPFLLAAKSADVALMKTLLDIGADPKIPTANGTTPLMVAAGVGIWAPGENPGTQDEALAAVRLALEVGAGDVNAIDENGDTAIHGAVYRGGSVQVIQLLADRGARLDVVNKKGWMPVTAADGVEYTPAVLKRYPDAAALLRKLMRERGLPVPASTQPGVKEGVIAGAPPAGTPGAPATSTPSAPPNTTKPAPPAAAAAPPAAAGAAAPVRLASASPVFSDGQAQRGQALYNKACAHCHAEDLTGEGGAAALIGQPFASRWNNVSVDEMLEVIRRTMPYEAPDSLGTQGYVDIISYLMKMNGHPSGAEELPTDSAILHRLIVTGRAN
jgi:ankyrin repeat protein